MRGAGFLTESYRNELCMEMIGRRKICLSYWSPTMTPGNELHELQVVATRLAELQQADILIYSGELTRPGDGNVALGRRNRSKRPNCLLILRTLGGSADAAYRLARALQRRYIRVLVYADDYCKGAGVLLALAADELVMSDFGELGPLDLVPSLPIVGETPATD